jgi:hypothetical protein
MSVVRVEVQVALAALTGEGRFEVSFDRFCKSEHFDDGRRVWTAFTLVMKQFFVRSFIGGSALSVGMLAAPSLAGVDTFGQGSDAFSLEFVSIGNAGNAADTTGNPNPSGAVSYAYNIGKNEINRRSIDKANIGGGLGITMTDMTNYGGNAGNKPATGVSWNEAARFVNWLNTSSGFEAAYKFTTTGSNDYNELWLPTDAGYNASNPYRNSNARYFITSNDEWYKAAYFNPLTSTYSDYANGTNTKPSQDQAGAIYGTIGGFAFPGPYDVDAAGALSSYGTMAQGGNVWEWTESASDLVNDSANERRIYRGGAWTSNAAAFDLNASDRSSKFGQYDEYNLGFRVGSTSVVPAPGVVALLGMSGVLARGRRRTAR